MDTLKRHILIVILTLATFLRIFNLATNPPALNWDEISMGYTSYSLLETGKDEWGEPWPILFRSYGEWKSPFYIYLLIPFIKIFGLNAWGVRLPAALMGILAIYLTYLIGKKLYSEKVGLWAAFFLTVSPWHLMLTRPAFEAGVALTLVLAGLNCFHNRSYVATAILFGLSLHTYHSAKIVIPLLILFLFFSQLKEFTFKKLLLPSIIFLIFLSPILSDYVTGKTQKRFQQVGITTDAELVERFFKYRNTFPLGELGNKLVFNKDTFLLSRGFSNWTSYLSPHFLLGSESIRAQHSIPFRGVLYFTEFALVVYGIITLFKAKRPLLSFLPVFVILVGFIPPALTKDIYHVLRSILTLPWWQILAALGMVELSKIKFKYLRFVIWALGFEIVSFLLIYFSWYPKAFARDWQFGYAEVASWLKANESIYDRVVITKAYGEPQLFLAFYNKWDPAWYQEENKKLLDYESQGYPWLDQLPEYSLGKYTFRDINWPVDNGKNEMLFVGKGDDFWLDTPFVFQTKFPDGTVAFSAAEGK